MSPKQIEVICPCCETLLTVDVGTGQVLRRVSAADRAAKGEERGAVGERRWGGAQDRVAQRPGDAAEKLERALDTERSRSSDLDDLFARAKKRVEDRSQRAAEDPEPRPGE